MATKSVIQNLINTNLADGSNIVASEHREVEDALLNELYATTLFFGFDNPLTGFTPLVSGLYYEMQLTKRGNNVNLQGYILNGTNGIIGSQNLFQIETSLSYIYPINAIPLGSFAIALTSNNKILQINPINKVLAINSNLGIGERVYFNMNYTTEE